MATLTDRTTEKSFLKNRIVLKTLYFYNIDILFLFSDTYEVVEYLKNLAKDVGIQCRTLEVHIFGSGLISWVLIGTVN